MQIVKKQRTFRNVPHNLQMMLYRLFKATPFWHNNRLILREIKHFPHIIVLIALCPLLAAVFEGFGVGFLLGFLQNLLNQGAQPFKTGIQWFDINILGIQTSEIERLCRVCGLIIISTWLRGFFNFAGLVTADRTKMLLAARLRQKLFEQLQALPLAFFSKTKVGHIINTFTAEVNNLYPSIQIISSLISRGLITIIYVAILLTISWQLSLIALTSFTLLTVGIARLNAQVRENSFVVSEKSAQFLAISTELVGAIRTVQAFGTQEVERQKFKRANQELTDAVDEITVLRSLTKPLSEGFATTFLMGIIILGVTMFRSQGSLGAAGLLTFLFLLFRLVPIVQEVNSCLVSISSFQGSLENIESLLARHDKQYLQNGAKPFPGLNKAIEFISVDFGYAPPELNLQDITLSIDKGKTVALVGASGAGKTTLADLIPRFYDPTQGKILFDGNDLRTYDVHSVRRRMAIVSQDTFIFNASVRDNIAYGTDGATDADVREAARLANALEFIEAMSEGWDTVLGDRGVRLSGGQRQRIAIARALLRNPEILILDEATSALDSVSERLIQESIEKLSVGRTVIAIAHRLSTIVRADKVVVMEKGRIVEQGTYQELLAQRGKLWNYHQMQHEVSQT
ncbi:heterocyst formation ABC transporter subunit HepA [Alkalinema pantanalense CENA528]|uniref:heterocyst formation ABC transporter subunit HepA n=1 Tax=Alkalinema pantanalense TaxID=1620705 RepID=UPI003D6F71C4